MSIPLFNSYGDEPIVLSQEKLITLGSQLKQSSSKLPSFLSTSSKLVKVQSELRRL